MQSSHVFTNITGDRPGAEMSEAHEDAQDNLFVLHTHK